jgi:hypothetical protein
MLPAALLLLAVATSPAAAPPPPITEVRNAAAGFAVTSALHVGAVAMLCQELPEPTRGRAAAALDSWGERNVAYVQAANAWTDHVVASVGAQRGPEAAAALRKTIEDEQTRQAIGMLRDVFPHGRPDAAACDRWSGIFVSEDFDLQKHEEFAVPLRELRAIRWPEGQP